MTWYPGRDRGTVLIPPNSVFVFGSKLMDLTAFFGSGTVMLLVAYWFMAWREATHATLQVCQRERPMSFCICAAPCIGRQLLPTLGRSMVFGNPLSFPAQRAGGKCLVF